MSVSYKGLVIKFGGDTTELQSALRTIQKASKDTKSDLNEINKALKFDPGNTELLEQKVRALNSAYDETKSRLDAYKQALSQLEAKKQSGEALTAEEERQYDSLKRAIMQCERQLESYGDELQSTQKEADASKTSLYKLGQTIEDNADKLSDAGKGVETAGKAITSGIAGAATALTGLATSQEEAIQQNAQLETAFQNAGGTVEQAQSVYASFYRLLGESDTATEASQNLIRLTQDDEELAKWTDIAAGAYATFGDALPLENLAETAQETAHTGAVTGSFADALNWSTASAEQWSAALSGVPAAQDAFNAAIAEGQTKEDAFNAALAACSDETERAQIVTDALAGVYGDAGKAFQETNADLLASRDAQNEMETSMRELGEAALPVKQAVAEIGTEVLDRLTPALEGATNWYKSLSPEQQELAKNLAVGALAFGGVTTAVGKTMQAAESIGGAFKTLATHGDLLKTGLEGVKTIFGGVSDGASVLFSVLKAHPFILIAFAIAAVVAGLVWFFTQTEEGQRIWGEFTAFVSEKWQALCDFFSGAADFFGGVWGSITDGAQDFADGLGEKWESLKTGAAECWEGIKTDAGNLAQGAFDLVSNAWSGLSDNTNERFGNIASTIQGDLATAQTVGSSSASALQAALSGDWATARTEAANAFSAIKDNISTKMGNARQSAIDYADAIGDKLGFPGLGSKVASVFDNVRSSITNALNNAWSAVSGIPGKIMSAFSNIRISLPSIKLPHFSVSWRNIGGVVQLPSISVNWYAKGGYFDQPSLIGVGESGGEFVAPERQLREFIEQAVNSAFSGFEGAAQSVSVSVELNATIADGMDAYQTGQQIGIGIASKLKQRGVSVGA